MEKIKLFLITSLLITFCLTSCGNNDEPSKFSDVTLKSGETKKLNSGANLKWTSENELIAAVEDGTINAYLVGETKIASDEGSFKVTVSPNYNYYSEPYMEKGASKSKVKSAMKNYTLENEKQDGTKDYLVYKGSNYIESFMFTLENNELKYSYFYTKATYVTELSNWLKERYVSLSSGDGYISMLSPDLQTLVIIMSTKLNSVKYFCVGYTIVDSNQSTMSNCDYSNIAKEIYNGMNHLTQK